jgi:hypothetical protein
MLTKEALMDQAEKAAQRSGKFRYPKKDTTHVLRVVEFEDEDGNTIFARPMTEHRVKDSSGKSEGICRQETFGLPCAYCKVNEIAIANGKGRIYDSRTRYVMNAVDIDNDPKTSRLWVMPTTIFNDIVGYGTDEEWADVCEAKNGYPFKITRSGSGLDTTYETKVAKKSYPLDKTVVAQVLDPLGEIFDPGITKQCAEIGVSIDKLFDSDELEAMEKDVKSKPKKEPKPKKESKKSKKKAVEAFNIGDTVRYKDEEDTCKVTQILSDTEITIEDTNGDEFDVGTKDCTPIGTETSSSEDKPNCFGDANLYDGEDEDCQKCNFQDECKGNIELDEAGVGKADDDKSKKSKKSADKDISGAGAADVVADLFG